MGTGELIVAAIMLLLAAGMARYLYTRTVISVPEHQLSIVERLGRYRRTLPPGRHLLMPGLDHVRASIDTRQQPVGVSTPVVTADEVVSIDASATFRVVDPVRATYEISAFRQGLEQALVTALRAKLGSYRTAEARRYRVDIERDLPAEVSEYTRMFGIEVTGVQLTAITTAGAGRRLPS